MASIIKSIIKSIIPLIWSIVVKMLFSAARKLIVWGLDKADSWLLNRVRASESEVDDKFYEAFREHRKDIEELLNKVTEMVQKAI